jgi:hypothetical protein
MSDFEQQTEELEALSSIFPTEFKSLDSNSIEYQQYLEKYSEWKNEKLTNLITVELQPQEDSSNQIHGIESSILIFCIILIFLIVRALLIAALKEDYPSSSTALVTVEGLKGLSGDQLEELKSLCVKTAEENLGMPNIFMVSSAIQEWLQENNIPGTDGSMYAGMILFLTSLNPHFHTLHIDMMRRMQKQDLQEKKVLEKAALKAAADSESKPQQLDLEELERIRKRQAGHPVTVESFNEWKKQFEEDWLSKMMENISADDFKLTGKQWFLLQKEKGLTDDDRDIEQLIEQGEQEEITEENILLELEAMDDEDEDDEDYVDEGDEDDDEDYDGK